MLLGSSAQFWHQAILYPGDIESPEISCQVVKEWHLQDIDIKQLYKF
jgi:hypothetical protein